MKRKIIIGSRGSELALWQANFVKDELKKAGIESEIKIIQTQGDKIQHLSLDKIEGKGFFTKEIEDALIAGETDLAVHSHKDLPTTSPEGLVIGAVSYREDPSELLIIRKECVDPKKKFSLKQNPIVGTSSARRKTQLLMFRHDVEIKDIRGNVPTRIKKLRDGEFDAILLAAAGIERLGLDLSDLHVEKLDTKEFIPAPAQGVLALQARKDDPELLEILKKINHEDVEKTIEVERKILNLFNGGCSLPMGAYCERDEDEGLYKVWAAKSNDWNTTPKLIYFETKREDVAELVVEKLNQKNPDSVFISRNVKPHDLFSRVLSWHGYKVSGRSLIEMKPIPFTKTPEVDWVFFSSKHAVRFFFEQNPVLGNVKYAAVGKGTAEELRKFGRKPDFIGYSTDTKLTGKQFAATAGSAKVLFPQAKGSLRSIQQQFSNQAKVHNLIVYETLKFNEDPVESAGIMVFTSPSNVEAFFEKNQLKEDQKIMAMGHATAAVLKNFGVKKYKMPASFDDIGLVQTVFSF